MTESPAPDRGPEGEAFKARPFAISQSAAVSAGSTRKGHTVDLLRMTDTVLVDRMWTCGQLSDRQHRAAKCLLTIWTDAGLNPRVVGNIPYVSEETHEREDPSEHNGPGPAPLAEGETWRDRYRRITKALGTRVSGILDGMMLDQHPGCSNLGTAQAALDELADRWGFERVGAV